MADGDGSEEDDVPAGAFAVWLRGMQRALRGEAESDVPCDGCTACCTSSQFVHIGPDETETLSRIPRQLLSRHLGCRSATSSWATTSAAGARC